MTYPENRTPNVPGQPTPNESTAHTSFWPQPTAYTLPGPPPLPSPPKKKHTARNVALAVAGAVVLAVCGIGGIGTLMGGNDTTTGGVITSDTTRDPTPEATTEATTAEPAVTDNPTTPAAKPKTTTFSKISHRQWALIAKNPDKYAGKGYVVYGVVEQFDSATGDDTFRANVDGVKRATRYDYETNTILTGDAERLSDFVEGDGFTAKVLVGGSFDYDTSIGGSTTVPSLVIMSISHIKVVEY
jgi:hypothetical protein